MKRYRITLRGNAPILPHRMTDETKEGLRTKGTKKVDQNLTPREIAARHVYRTNDGHSGLPARSVLACLISAGKFHAYKGKQKLSTRSSTMVTMFCRVEGAPDELLTMTNHDGEPIPADSFEVTSDTGVNPNTNNAVVIDRPKFTEWALVIDMSVDAKEIDDKKFRALWKTAGQLGLGAWRPEKRGFYGTFDAEVEAL